MKRIFLFAGLLLLIVLEIARVYFIMPFPGSQVKQTINIAYFLDRNIIWIRIILILVLLFPLASLFKNGRWPAKISAGILVAFYIFIFYLFNFRFEADKMFYQPSAKLFASADHNKIDMQRLVVGVMINGEAKAFPIQLIGYHHQVRDTIGGTSIMVTYCTVCRTGRVYSPVVNGKNESFRLVGMDHFNAMFEDADTHSWWQQATGMSIAGKLKGTKLTELPSRQETLADWLDQYPNSLIMQPDPSYKEKYNELAGYDDGTIRGSLEKRDSLSWKNKSWVIGVRSGSEEKVYDWNQLLADKIIQDSIGIRKDPVILFVEKDQAAFHVWNRIVDGRKLSFALNQMPDELTDINTHSTWNKNGLCTDGPLKGEHLAAVQSYQEFWHSWKYFHPSAQVYGYTAK